MPRLRLQVVGLLGVNFGADFRSQSVFSRLAEIAPAPLPWWRVAQWER